jgi:hypothetical protein
MTDLNIRGFINGHEIYYDQLEEIEYERAKHVLHEMKNLGAKVKNRGETLSHQAIDALSIQQALKINIDTRNQYSMSEMQELYKEELKISDAMWKKANEGFEFGKDRMQESKARLIVTGIDTSQLTNTAQNPEELGEASADSSAIMNPEHFFISPRKDGLEGMETFGMYGEPTDMIVKVDNDIQTQIQRDPVYPIVSAGFPLLASDGTPMHNIPYHQYKPIENGLDIKLAVLLPPKAPKEIAIGHQWHLAIEFWEMMKAAGNR